MFSTLSIAVEEMGEGSQRVRVLRSANADGTVWVEQGYFVSAKGKGVCGKTVAGSVHACRVR